MNENKINNNGTVVLDLLGKLIPVSLAFLVPIFFLVVTSEFFSFNKLALVIVTTILLVFYWATKLLLGQKMGFVKSMLDLPLLTYLLVIALSSFFSISKTDSIFGSMGRWTGLVSFAVFLIYFFLSTPLIKSVRLLKASLYAFLTSSTLAVIVATLSYFKIYVINVDYLKVQNFSLAGSTTDTTILAALVTVLALGLIAYEKNLLAKVALVFTVIVSYIYLSLIGLPIGFIVLGVGIIGLLMYIDLNAIVKSKIIYGAALLFVVMFTALVLLPTTRSVLISKSFPYETKLSMQPSWFIASSIIQSYPLLATGPATFYLNFTRFKPLSLNSTDLWNTRFDAPSSEFFNQLATVGIVGLIVALFLGMKILKLVGSAKLNRDESGISKILSAAILSLLIAYLFTVGTILNFFIMMMLLGMLVAAHALTDTQVKLSESVMVEADVLSSIAGGSDENSVIKKSYYKFIVATPIILLTVYMGYLFAKTYVAEFYMRQSLYAAVQGNGKGTYDYQRMAINLNPNRDSYQTVYAQTNLAIANNMASQPDLTDTDKQTIQALISQSIRSAQIATEVVGPLNASNWEVRASIYSNLLNVAQNAQDWAVAAYNNAIQLDPANPRLRVDLGGIYFANKDYLTAANQFRQATALKADYANAYYNFASALVQLKDYQNARLALEATKNLLPQDSPDYKTVETAIASLPAPQVAGAATAKPTVEQITGNTTATTQNQQPLNNAGNAQSPVESGTLPVSQTQPKATGSSPNQ